MRRLIATLLCLPLTACVTADPDSWPFEAEPVATLDQPWALAFLPDGRAMVTAKAGTLHIIDTNSGDTVDVTGVPDVDYGGQGGLGDVALHPEFNDNQLVYLSWAEAGDDIRGAAVGRARLVETAGEARLENLEIVWRQTPKVSGRGHYGHRLLFDDGGYLFISSGERQKFDPSQDMSSNMGKILRLHDDGSLPEDNPFADQGGVAAEVWTLGHRNPLGIDFDTQGRLWNTEMGPKHGDELNLVIAGRNYGYPLVSNGDHYSGKSIPDHDTRPDLEAPKAWWDPSIAPSSLHFVKGGAFGEWDGSALIGGLVSQALIRVEVTADSAAEAERFDMGHRIRDVAQGPDGALWVLEDGEGGQLLRLSPKAD